MAATPIPLTPGLFGKLPAHGDFIQRGWDVATVAALDAWLTDGLAAARARGDDEAFMERLMAAPLWQGYAPPGWAGPHALHLALSPSVDRAGRHFFIAAGVAGSASACWSAALDGRFAASAEDIVYSAFGDGLDADAVLWALTEAMPELDARQMLLAGASAPAEAMWWISEPAEGEPVLVRAAAPSPGLVGQLLDGGR